MGRNFQELETNDSGRLRLPSEVELNRQAISVVPGLLTHEGWQTFPLLSRKIADFWFSSDQFLDTRSLPPAQRAIRLLGVLAYLVVLAFALCGIVQLYKTRSRLAALFALYAVGFTMFHLPFVMNTGCAFL
jgi:hypothetical protein